MTIYRELESGLLHVVVEGSEVPSNLNTNALTESGLARSYNVLYREAIAHKDAKNGLVAQKRAAQSHIESTLKSLIEDGEGDSPYAQGLKTIASIMGIELSRPISVAGTVTMSATVSASVEYEGKQFSTDTDTTEEVEITFDFELEVPLEADLEEIEEHFADFDNWESDNYESEVTGVEAEVTER